MSSTAKPFGLKIHGYVKPEVKVSTAKCKRKKPVERSPVKNGKKIKKAVDSEEETIYPECLLKIEVNESDDIIYPGDITEDLKEPETEKHSTTKEEKRKQSKTKQNKSKQAKPKTPPKLPQVKPKEEDPPYLPPSPRKRGRPSKNRTDLENGEETKDSFRCSTCNREFVCASSLEQHLSTHVGNLKCPMCGITFSNKNNLGKHVATHEKTERCVKCPAAFHTKDQLEEHYRKNKHIIPEEKKKDEDNTDEKSNVKYTSRSDVHYNIQNAIVTKMHKGVPITDICRLYNVTPEIVNEIWDDRDLFILPEKIDTRTIKYVNSIVQPLLRDWYNDEKSKDVHITAKMLVTRAETIAKERGFVHFNAGNKWLERFKKKYNIYLNKSRRDYTNTPAESIWKSKFFEEHWPRIRPYFSDDQIYMADEVGLFYNPSKSREKKFSSKKFIQGEITDRLSIFLCTNMSGTDKRRLLVCGTEDPLKYSFRDVSTLPVKYKRHSQCHFTTHMFEEYVQEWNEILKKDDKKSVLIVDRASIHSKLTLSHLKLEFLPWKANGLQPIKTGVFAGLRSEFRDMLLQFKTMNIVKGQDRNLTCLEALHMLAKAWERTPSNLITKSFLDLGYDAQTITEDSTKDVQASCKDSERLCEFLQDYNVESYFGDTNTLDMYLTVDDKLLVGQGTNPTVFGGNHKGKTEPLKTASDELPVNTERPLTNDLEAVNKLKSLQDLETVRKYLQANSTSFEMYRNFLNVEKEVMDIFVQQNVEESEKKSSTVE